MIYLQVPVHNVQLMEVLDGFQDLQDDAAGILLRVAASLQNSVQQLASSHPKARTDYRSLPQLTQDTVLWEINMYVIRHAVIGK